MVGLLLAPSRYKERSGLETPPTFKASSSTPRTSGAGADETIFKGSINHQKLGMVLVFLWYRYLELFHFLRIPKAYLLREKGGTHKRVSDNEI